MLDIQPYSNFGAAARAVLGMLRARLPYDLWMVTRTEGDDWIVLQADDHGYGVKPGTVFRWADSFCARMVAGEGPRIAPRSADVPAYASAPIARRIPIGSYVGIPLAREDGSLFGTLCAIHPTPHPPEVAAELPAVELLGRLLCTILNMDLRAVENARRADHAQAEALTDALTSLHNRRGWDLLAASEERRCRALGLGAAVWSIDLDDLKRVNDTEGHAAGDTLIQVAAQAIRNALRSKDVAARIGGDEFFVLAVDCDARGAARLDARLHRALRAAGVDASVGVALRDPREGLEGAIRLADRVMYASKNVRHASAASTISAPFSAIT